MEIKVNDLNNILLDGQNAGSVTDVLLNHGSIEGLREAILKACHEWHGAVVADHQEMHASATEKQQAEHTDAIEKLKAEHDKTVADLRADLDQHKAHVEALGGTELAQRLRREADLKAAHEAKAQAEARIAELTADTTLQ